MAVMLGMPAPAVSHAQSVEELQKQLVGQPLYLRGFWMGQALEFDGEGHAAVDRMKPGDGPGPLTLSGVDVRSVETKGHEMVLHGDRVALVADDKGRLQRRDVKSTTRMFGTFQKEYRAKQEVKIVIHADADGSYAAALRAVFANGLAELATSVPPYWRCYAAAYFAEEVPAAEAERTVEDCVAKTGVPETKDGSYVAPKMIGRLHVTVPWETSELAHDKAGVNAEFRAHFVVGPRGVPLRFQMVRAVGAGLDEEVLQALSEMRFEPATQDGAAVAANDEYAMTFRSDKK